MAGSCVQEIRDGDGRWRGMSVDLWTGIAQALGRDFEFVPLPFPDVLPSLEAGRVDVAVGALTMTPEREARIDFTHPFYQTGLAIGHEDHGGPEDRVRAGRVRSLLSVRCRF